MFVRPARPAACPAACPAVRPARPAARPAVWALDAVPNIGTTADPAWPLDPPPPDRPPAAFPDLAGVPQSFTSAGGALLVVEHAGHLLGRAASAPAPPPEPRSCGSGSTRRPMPSGRRDGEGDEILAARVV